MNPFQNLPLEWQKLMRDLAKIAGQMKHGKIVITVHEKKPEIAEYTIKRKVADTEDFTVKILEEE